MLTKTFDIVPDYTAAGAAPPRDKATLSSYILSPDLLQKTRIKTRPAVIVCPGGGYGFRSAREAEAVALKYCAAGFHAFVLNYSVEPAEWPIPQCQLATAVALVREMAEKHGIDKQNIYVCGFSAGGHLAVSLGVHYDKRCIAAASGGKNRPDGLILCYPVIIDEEGKTHAGTKERFVGKNPENEKYFGLDKFVTKDTPPCFIWHTFDDKSVPVYSSMRFAQALLDHGVEYELHIFPKGSHGLSLANILTANEDRHIEPSAEAWIDLSVKWLYDKTNFGK